MDNVVRIRVGYDRIFTEYEKTFDIAGNHLRKTFCGFRADIVIQLRAPGLLKLLRNAFFSQFLISRELIRQRAHIAGTLYVILTADRIDAAAGTPKLPCHHRHIGKRHAGSEQSAPCSFSHVSVRAKVRKAIQISWNIWSVRYLHWQPAVLLRPATKRS